MEVCTLRSLLLTLTSNSYALMPTKFGISISRGSFPPRWDVHGLLHWALQHAQDARDKTEEICQQVSTQAAIPSADRFTSLCSVPPPPPSPLQYLDANKPPSPTDRYIYKSGEERRVRDTSVPRQRGPLMDEIRAWLDGASRDELKRLPQMLRATQLSAMAEKLEKRLEEIKQGGNCSSV